MLEFHLEMIEIYAFDLVRDIHVQAGLRGIRTILTLTDNWPDYGGVEYYIPWSPTAQSRNDFFTDPIVKDIYKTYFFNIATRVNSITNVQYRNDPRIFCWELINEPRIPGPGTHLLEFSDA